VKRGRPRLITTDRQTLRKRSERRVLPEPGRNIDITNMVLEAITDWVCWHRRNEVDNLLRQMRNDVKEIVLEEIDRKIAELTVLREHVQKFRDK